MRAGLLAERYVGFLDRWKWLVLLLAVALTALSIYGMKGMRYDNSDESFFQDDDPAILAINKFRDTFGNEDAVYVAVRTKDGVFSAPMLKLLDGLADELDAKVPHIKKVTWVGSAEYMRGTSDEITTGPIFEDMPDRPEDVEHLRRTVMNYPDFVNTYVSADEKTAVIILECKRYPKDAKDPRKEIAPAIYSVLAEPQYRGLSTSLAGAPVQDFESDRITSEQTVKLTLVCIALQALLLFKAGSGLRAVFSPILIIFLSIVLTLGIVAAMGWTVSMMDIMLPTMLFSVCLGVTVHIIANYHMHKDYGLPHRQAMVRMIQTVFVPCLFTSLTTMMGFLSFLSTEIVPIRMAGVYSAIGVGVAFVLAVTLTPIAYLIYPERGFQVHIRLGRPSGHIWLDRLLQRQLDFSIRHKWAVIAFFLATSIASVWLYQSVAVETNTLKDISTSEKLRRDSDFFDESLGGAMTLEIMVDAGKINGARDLAFLKDMELLQRHAETFPKTVKTHSVVDTLERVSEVLHGENPAYHRLPDEQKLVSQYLFFYETSGGKNLDKELSLESDIARIHIQTRNMGTQEITAFTREMDRFVGERLGGRLNVQYTGQMAWVAAIADYVKQGQALSFSCALLSIGLMMIVCLRSVWLGLLSMLPNVAPILLPMGLMGLCGINLSLVLMIFSCVIMGVCVDDTTHFYVTMKREFSRLGRYRDALQATVRDIGRPVVFTSVSLVLGFLVFTLSVVRTTGEFGILGAVAFFWGCLADLTFSPALFAALRPLGPERIEAKPTESASAQTFKEE